MMSPGGGQSIESGDIFGSGCNTDGQLGLGHANDVHSLTRLRVPDSFEVENREGGIDKVVAGGDSSGFITKSGKLFTWGNSVRWTRSQRETVWKW